LKSDKRLKKKIDGLPPISNTVPEPAEHKSAEFPRCAAARIAWEPEYRAKRSPTGIRCLSRIAAGDVQLFLSLKSITAKQYAHFSAIS